MSLAQGHNTVTPVRLEPGAPRSRVKHSATELPQVLYNVMSFITLCLGMDSVISEPCYKETIGSHKMTVLYPNLCFNKVCYKGTVL